MFASKVTCMSSSFHCSLLPSTFTPDQSAYVQKRFYLFIPSTPLLIIQHLCRPSDIPPPSVAQYGDPRRPQASNPRIRRPPSLPTPLHNRPPLRIQHPRMALYPHRRPRHPLLQRAILGHPNLPTRVPLRPARHPHAHPLRALPNLHSPLPVNIRLPSEELQSCLVCEYDSDRPNVFHEQRRNDGGESESIGERAAVACREVEMVE